MNVSALFIRRPVMTTLLMLAIFVAGVISFKKLPVSDLPNIDYPKISISANYTGAAAETMVKLVTMPLEKELINVSGVKEISSTTSRGSTEITLDFDLDKNLDEATREVQVALNRAEGRLPPDMEQKPSYQKQSSGNEPIMYFVLTSHSMSVAEMREYGEKHIEPRLSRIEGVASIDTFGAPHAIKIHLNPDLMASRHLGIDQVLNAIRQHNADLPLGTIKTGTRRLTIEVSGQLQNAKDFDNIVVGPGPILLKDIGEISEGAEYDQEFHFLSRDGKEGTKNSLALIFGIKKISGTNTVAISQAVHQILPDIQKNLPLSMELNLWFDKATWINESIVDVEWSLLFAFVLVVGVIFFSLGRLSDALIPSIALPMSLIGTFIAMYWLHFSLDILSLLALTLSVGFVVDDAIVVLENIVRQNEKGEKPLAASLIGSKEICFTILSMTLSLVAVFIPILFMGGMNGRLFHEFSITLAIAILISGFISLTLTPMLCSLILSSERSQTKDRKSHPLSIAISKFNARMVNGYSISLKWCFRHPKTVLAIAITCFIATIPMFKSLPIDLFPQEDRGFVFSIVNLPKGLSSAKALEYQKKIETMVFANPHVETLLAISWPDGQLFLSRLTPKDTRPPQAAVINQIQNTIDSIPGTQTFTMGWQLINVDMDLGSGGNMKYLVRGMDGNAVEKAAEQLKSKMHSSSDFPFVNLSVTHDEPKLVVSINEEQAKHFGVSKKDIQSIIQHAFAGSAVTNVNKGDTQQKVYVELAEEFRNNPAALAKLYVKSRDDKLIPLKALVTWTEELGTPSIQRVDQLPTVTVHFALNKDIAQNIGIERLSVLAANTLPANVTGRLEGSAAAVSSTVQDTALLLLAAAVVMYIVLGMLYESFIHPLTILSSLPLAGLGGLITLYLCHEPLSLYSIMGFLLLIGIVKKNGIMMIDFALEARKDPTISAEQAIYQGCMVRFRPIMMTTIAAIMGAIPIAIGMGEGGETRQGLGLVIAGGLIFSQLLTLFITPVIYLSFEKMKNLFQARIPMQTS